MTTTLDIIAIIIVFIACLIYILIWMKRIDKFNNSQREINYTVYERLNRKDMAIVTHMERSADLDKKVGQQADAILNLERQSLKLKGRINAIIIDNFKKHEKNAFKIDEIVYADGEKRQVHYVQYTINEKFEVEVFIFTASLRNGSISIKKHAKDQVSKTPQKKVRK